MIFCRAEADRADGGCVDLVVEFEATPAWQITDVRCWGFPNDRWHLDFVRHASIEDQLTGLARTLPARLDQALDVRGPSWNV